jgi:threonylcarbamoyladenosine tRNA methylthiotransferase MtaB
MFFRTQTLGCKVNQYETEFVRQGLLRLGWQDAADGETATLVVVNTCTVTAESDLKSRKAIRKLIKENPGAEVVVMGCSATRNPAIIAAISGVTQILTNKQQIPEFLRQRGLQEIPTTLKKFGERHRAFVKVQDGCRVGCSYCIIPKVRPILRSRPVAEVLDEIRTLSRNGYREIVLTGIHLGHYGVDFDKRENLASLVEKVIELDEPFRLRISSLEAVEVSDELVDLMVANPKRICPHLHLSMQSGSDSVLRRMKRRWLSEPFIRRCEEISTRFDRLALTTDIIVGFPGETEAEFAETLHVVERLKFSKVHVFRFSPREGTEAATLPNRISPSVQQHRAADLGKLADRLRRNYAASLVGRNLSVMLETPYGGTADRYVEVRLAEPIQQLGTLIDVHITHADGDLLHAVK